MIIVPELAGGGCTVGGIAVGGTGVGVNDRVHGCGHEYEVRAHRGS